MRSHKELVDDSSGKATQNRRQEKAQKKARRCGQLEEDVELQPVNELQPVRAALMSVNLGQYADELDALGYDFLPDLQTSSEVERAEIAKEVGMAPGHAKRFIKMFAGDKLAERQFSDEMPLGGDVDDAPNTRTSHALVPDNSASASSSQFKYRPDIDGLRAVAVLSVIAFHMQKSWLPGGFTGVDIFFVSCA